MWWEYNGKVAEREDWDIYLSNSRLVRLRRLRRGANVPIMFYLIRYDRAIKKNQHQASRANRGCAAIQ